MFIYRINVRLAFKTTTIFIHLKNGWRDWGKSYWKFYFTIIGLNSILKCIQIKNSYFTCNNIWKYHY